MRNFACPTRSGRFRLTEMLKTTRIVKRETGGKVFINGRADQGPIALALALVGPQQFLTMLMQPEMKDWCQKLVGFCSRVNVALGEAQLRAGADSSTIGLAGASLISPALFDAFELPGARAFCAAMRRAGGFGFVHACGDETIMLENLLATRRGLPGIGPGNQRGNMQACGAGPGERAGDDRSGAGDAFRHAGDRAAAGKARCWPRWAAAEVLLSVPVARCPRIRRWKTCKPSWSARAATACTAPKDEQRRSRQHFSITVGQTFLSARCVTKGGTP